MNARTLTGIVAALLCVRAASAEELLVFDWNKPVTTSNKGFPWDSPPMASANGNWTSPVNYAEGTLYYRVEIRSQPVAQNMKLQFCFWQDMNLHPNHLENCGPTNNVVGTPGTVVTWSASVAGMWKLNGVPIDWTRARDRNGVAIKNSSGQPVSDYAGWNWNGEDPAEWYPLDMRFTVVVVSKNGSFYSAAALFVLFVDVLLFSTLSLSVGFYFIWAFTCAFLFSLARHRILKAIALLASPFFLIRVAVEVLSLPDLALTEALLLSTRGDLLLAFMTLPFLLMLIRLDFLIRHPVLGRRSFALRMTSLVAGVVVIGLLLYVILSRPYGEEHPQPITVTETVDYPAFTRTLSITSPAPLNQLTLEHSGETYQIDTGGREWVLSLDRLPDVLSVRLSTAEFLDRDRALLEIDAPYRLESLAVQFASEEPLEIYDISYPFSRSPDQRTAEVHIGRRPDVPIRIEYTMATGTYPGVTIVAHSSHHPEPIALYGNNIVVDTELVVRTEFAP